MHKILAEVYSGKGLDERGLGDASGRLKPALNPEILKKGKREWRNQPLFILRDRTEDRRVRCFVLPYRYKRINVRQISNEEQFFLDSLKNGGYDPQFLNY